MNICVFGSSSRNIESIYMDAVRQLGCTLGAAGHTLVFGGYDMGLMGAIARGFVDGGGRVSGVVTEGLSAKGDREVFACTEVITTANLAERKQLMIEMADAFVTVPGGIGTLDELFDVMSISKAGECHKPCAIYNVAGFFDPLVQMLDDMCTKGLNSTDWHTHARAFASADELCAYLDSASEE